MATVQMKNKAGQFVEPKAETFKAAAAGAEWEKVKDFYLILTDAPGKNSWPIAGSTFILMHKTQEKPEQAKAALKFFHWAYSKGQGMAEELNYVTLPSKVAALIEKNWKTEIKSKDGAVIFVP